MLSLMKNRWTREGAGKPPPASGLPLFGFLFVTHWTKFIRANLLFLLFSLPVVTIPAALCGLNRVMIKLILDGNVFLWDEFIAEFKGSFKKSLPLGVIFGGGLLIAWYLLSIGVANGDTIFGMLFSALGISAIIPVAVFGGWSFVMMAMLPLGAMDTLKNARALTGLAFGRSAAICGIVIGSALFTLFVFPVSLPVVALILIAFAQYTMCFLVVDPVKRYIVDPWEAAQESAAEKEVA